MNRSSKFIAFALVAAMLLLSLPASLLAEPARTAPEGYNEHDYSKCVSFLEIEDEDGVKNGTKLNPDYDPDDPGTWLAEGSETLGFFWEETEGEQRLSVVKLLKKQGYSLYLVGTLDLQDCSELRELYCGRNPIEEVIVLGCANLEILDAWSATEISSLDVTQCPALRYLDFSECYSLSKPDLEFNSELEVLVCNGVPMNELDVTGKPNLVRLECSFTDLMELDISCNPLLETLKAAGNHCESIDLSNNTNLSTLILNDNEELSELNVSMCPLLTILQCECCRISSGLDLSCNPELEVLLCGYNPLHELDVTHNEKIRWLECVNCGLSELNTSCNPLLEELNASGNHICSFDFSYNTNLTTLLIDNTDISELDVSMCPELFWIYCDRTHVRYLDFTNNPLIQAEKVRADGRGYIGYSQDIYDTKYISAVPEDGYTFEGWFTENGELLSTLESIDIGSFAVVTFIARFSAGVQHIPGDIDANGSVEVTDAIMALRAAMGIIELTPEQLSAADVNGDELIRIDDAVTILRISMGLLS